ncbi:hypothetical protein NIES25_44290 [Nostoc linckia NIES-25]|nr:hypothetical protein NIES25_44290 [Nostoc linckia NIES-25]
MPLFNSAQIAQAQFIQLLDKKTSGTNGGTATGEAWTNRVVNTINVDETGQVTLTSNLFVLPAGTYQIDAITTFYTLNNTKIRLQNTSDNLAILYGANSYFNPGGGAYGQTFLKGKFTIGASKELALQYWTQIGFNSNQFNLGGQVGDGSPEIYTVINLWKV